MSNAVSACADVPVLHLATEDEANLLDEEGEAIPATHRDHYDRWAPVATTIPPGEVLQPYMEGSLAKANAASTVSRLEAHGDRVRQLTHLDQEMIWNVGGIAQGYLYVAAMLRTAEQAKPEPTGPLLRDVRADRQRLLRVAQAGVVAGLISEEKIARIEAGRGTMDTIEDVLDLILVLRNDAPMLITSGVLVSEAFIREAEQRASRAQSVFRPGAAPPQPKYTDADRAALTLLRNQMWTLLVRAHDEALLAAAHIVGVRRVNDLVPSLGSRQGLKKPAASTESAEANETTAA